MPQASRYNGEHKMRQNTSAENTQRALQSPQQQAADFGSVRQAHRMETTEDYVELIDDLIRSSGEARLVDIAVRLGVSQPTVSKTLARLQREGFVTSEPYRSVFLTEKGKLLADQTRERHDTVYRFLRTLGVSDKIAKRDSEGLEHHVSTETLRAFRRFMRQYRST